MLAGVPCKAHPCTLKIHHTFPDETPVFYVIERGVADASLRRRTWPPSWNKKLD